MAFAALLLGLSLLLGSAASIVYSLLTPDGRLLLGAPDYQQTTDFRNYISQQLELFLGVATGGKGWRNYGVGALEYGGYYGYGTLTEDFAVAGSLSDEEWDQYMAEREAHLAEIAAAEADAAQRIYGETDVEAYFTPERLMRQKGYDQNLLYAIIGQCKVLYTNIPGQQAGAAWQDGDLAADLPAGAYNFTLWYNRAGDGKVQITKDGKAVDVYGDGVYTAQSRWFVPGYSNFVVDDSTRAVTVFLAAAQTPKLYVVGDYSDYGSGEYGGRLYYLQQDLVRSQARLRLQLVLAAVGLVLLAVGLCMRQSLRAAHRAVAAVLQRVWLELKLLVLLCLPIGLLLATGGDSLRDLWWLLQQQGQLSYGEIAYYLTPALTGGLWALGCFWAVYLAVLDRRYNRGRQRTLLLGALCGKGLEMPVQQRLVRRYRLTWLAVLVGLPLAVLGMASGLWALCQADGYDSMAEYLYEGSFDVAGFGFMLLLLGALLLLALLCVAVGVSQARHNRRLAEDLGALCGQIAAVHDGDLHTPQALPQDADLHRAAAQLGDIQQGMETALRRQMQSERMKVELVTNVSHDIKTPLTAIISYIELLKQQEDLSAEVRDFVAVLDEKAQRLKAIVQDVFEISKAAAGQLPLRPERLDLAKLLRQTLAEMDGPIRASGLQLKADLPSQPVPVLADGQRLYRVFQNLLQNALQYSLTGSRIYLTLRETAGEALVQLKNISAVPLDDSTDFTARFVRGDASRTDGGSGLGLSIAQSFVEACGGGLQVTVNADLFIASVRLPLLPPSPDDPAAPPDRVSPSPDLTVSTSDLAPSASDAGTDEEDAAPHMGDA